MIFNWLLLARMMRSLLGAAQSEPSWMEDRAARLTNPAAAAVTNCRTLVWREKRRALTTAMARMGLRQLTSVWSPSL